MQIDIRTRCEKLVREAARRAAGGSLTTVPDLTAVADLAAPPNWPDPETAGPVIAAVFADCIHAGCILRGAIHLNGTPDLARYWPCAGGAQQAPDTGEQTRTQDLEHAMLARLKEFVAAHTAGDIDRADQIYRDAVRPLGPLPFVRLLWAMAVTVFCDARAHEPCPHCIGGTLLHLHAVTSAAYTCGHIEALGGDDLPLMQELVASLHRQMAALPQDDTER